MVYYKQEKFVLAEFHFKKALTINPYNSTLLCTIAVVSGCGCCVVFLLQLPQPFYDPFSGTTRVSRCQKRTSGLYGARLD